MPGPWKKLPKLYSIFAQAGPADVLTLRKQKKLWKHELRRQANLEYNAARQRAFRLKRKYIKAYRSSLFNEGPMDKRTIKKYTPVERKERIKEYNRRSSARQYQKRKKEVPEYNKIYRERKIELMGREKVLEYEREKSRKSRARKIELMGN